MADVTLHPIIQQIRGKVGDLVFRRYRDRTVLMKKPDFEGYEPSEAQQAVRDRFREANEYAKAVMADPEARAPYERLAAEPDALPIYNLVMSDYLNEPTVDDIDLGEFDGRPGDEIVVTARDKYAVLSVEVVISDEALEAEIERGAAEQEGEHRWVYRTRSEIKAREGIVVRAITTDRPGGTGEALEEAFL